MLSYTTRLLTMTLSDDEFGDINDEDLIFAASQADCLIEETPQPSPKRRRLNPSSFRGSEDALQNATSSPQSSQDLFVTQISNDEQQAHEIRKPQTPEPKQKSNHRVHIPKNAELPDDSFRTQISHCSQSPYRIRAGVWQKPRLRTPTPEQLTRIDSEALGHDKNLRQTIPQAPDGHPRDSHLGNSVITHNSTESTDSPSLITWEEPIEISSQQDYRGQWQSQIPRARALVAPPNNLRQTTLFGTQASITSLQTQSDRRHNWPSANKDEPPTHHKLDKSAMRTWVYPTNLGSIRDYQYNIVARGLYHNLLVALPTGLGKTFIAATVMLNWFRWTSDSQIVFVAPTKPLVSQQVEACFNIAGIPRSATTLLTGNTAPGIRAEEWSSKRVFFMTPQTIINDLKTGICDPKRIVLLVVDEAHRATGAYAYVEVVKFLRRFNTSFRVLGLTATPGSTVESVQAVIDGLGISRVEIRTENSLDIRQYVHQRNIETITLENTDDMIWIMDKFSKVLQPLVDKIRQMNAYWSKDPMTLTAYGCMQNRQKWMASDAGRKANMGVKGMIIAIFNVLASLAHAIDLLKYHGIVPFYHKLRTFQQETMEGRDKGGKYRRQVTEHEQFRQLTTRLKEWALKPDFMGHPKLEYLQGIILNHFVSASEGRNENPDISPAKTRIMVFAHFRDSAEEIVRVLNRNNPMIRPQVFVGQANSAGSDGMDQKTQLKVIEDFKKGVFNTLVATSIGEEGLDIGEVDMIICYDASASPIRMLQRMGRTGRKHAGNVAVLLMKGKEETNFTQAKDNYEKMQRLIAAGTRFTFHETLSPRIIPRDIQPLVDKREVEIPLENTQAELPEPKKRGRPPKRPPKKFHMPDNVHTGFTKASRLHGYESESDKTNSLAIKPPRSRTPTPEPMPPLDSVLLSSKQQQDLERSYLQVASENPETVEFPRFDTFPVLQRRLRPSVSLGHGKASKRLVKTLKTISQVTDNTIEAWKKTHDTMSMSTYFNEYNTRSSKQNHKASEALSSSALARRRVQVEVDEMDSSPDSGSVRDEPFARDADVDIAAELGNFIDDTVITMGTTDSEGERTSPMSSPPSMKSMTRKTSPESRRMMQVGIESSQDLPDVGSLIQTRKPIAPVELEEESDDPPMQRQKKRRGVVESDSDES